MLLAIALLVAVVAATRGMWSPCGLSMLSSLNPVSERARGHRFALTAAWYVVGATIGGALLGGAAAVLALGLGALGPPPLAMWTLALVVALVALVSDTGVAGRALPVHPRQVDERWLVRYRRWIYAAGYGVQIGSGFATYIMTAAVYLLFALAVLTASPAQALLCCVVFGVVRGCCIVVAGRARSPERLRQVMATLVRSDGASLRAAVVVEVVVALVAAVAVGGGYLGATVGVAALALLVVRPAVARRSAP